LFGTGNDRLSLLSTTGMGDPVALIETPHSNVYSGRVSRDGKWIAYCSDESGRMELYISPYPNPVGKLQVSIAGGCAPRWRQDGNELFYLAPDNTLMAAELITINGSVQVAKMQTLFKTAATLGMYDVAPDGRSFAVSSANARDPVGAAVPLNLIVNWTAKNSGAGAP
jgi:Tol biopolymer transport system component